MKLDLSDPEDAELLSFILDVTIERWQDKLLSSVASFAEDRSIKSMSEMLTLSGNMTEMITRAQAIRSRLDIGSLRERTVTNVRN